MFLVVVFVLQDQLVLEVLNEVVLVVVGFAFADKVEGGSHLKKVGLGNDKGEAIEGGATLRKKAEDRCAFWTVDVERSAGFHTSMYGETYCEIEGKLRFVFYPFKLRQMTDMGVFPTWRGGCSAS